MKRHVTLFLISMVFTSCYQVERNCLPFHEGTYEFTTVINGTLKTSRFERYKDYEIEYFEGKTDTANIRWVNNCECILTKRHPVSNQDKRPIRIEILTTKKSEYTFEYALVGDTKNVQRGTIKKIE